MFAAGHAETGNDIPVLMSTCVAERVEGGYRFTGRKKFGSNGPVWSLARRPRHRLRTRRAARRSSTASSTATSPGVTVVETWDTLGMRPTQSHDTVLDGAFVPDATIGRVVPAGDGTTICSSSR